MQEKLYSRAREDKNNDNDDGDFGVTASDSEKILHQNGMKEERLVKEERETERERERDKLMKRLNSLCEKMMSKRASVQLIEIN